MLARIAPRQLARAVAGLFRRQMGIIAAALGVVGAVWLLGGALYEHKSRQHIADINEYIVASFRRDAAQVISVARGAPAPRELIDQITGEISAGRLLRYKLFDATGYLRLDTEIESWRADGGATIIAHNPAAAKAALNGQLATKIVSQGDRLLAETYVPLLENGTVVAVQEFYVDQTQKAAALRTEMTLLFSLGFCVAGFAFGVPALAWRRKSAILAKSRQELDEARLFMTTVFDHVPAAIIVKEAATLKCVAANKAVADIHVIDRDAFVGRKSSEFFDASYSRRIDENDRAALASGSSEPAVMETRMQTPGRGERIVVSKRLAIPGATGEPAWLITILDDVTDMRAADERARYLANHDVLTGLANRARFQSCLETWLARPRHEQFALVLFDLDGFKEINDTFGHAAGDQVLRVTGQRLADSLGASAVVARLGGDEFAALIDQQADAVSVESILARAFEAIQTAISYEDHRLHIQLSAGLVLSDGDSHSPDLMLREADTALYEAKNAGKGVWRSFSPEMMERRLRRKLLELDLHRAIAGRHFELHYQPIVCMNTGAIVSMEALVRWNHPERGYIPPLDFIPIAEESGLILPLGEMVIAMACEAAMEWPQDVRVSVNLSPVQFRDRSLSRKISETLARIGLPPQRLELEITEATLLENSQDNVALLNELRSAGIRIAMDDFGSGYSSLNYLRNFPFDKIKIDRSYVRDLDSDSKSSRTILDAVLAMAEGLDVATTAEGVETQEQMDILRRAGCTEMQGYFISRPVPRNEVAAVLNRGGRGVASAA